MLMWKFKNFPSHFSYSDVSVITTVQCQVELPVRAYIYSIVWSASALSSCSVAFQSTLRVIGVLTGSVCGHSGRDDFTTQARLIYVGKALRAPTECGED